MSASHNHLPHNRPQRQQPPSSSPYVSNPTYDLPGQHPRYIKTLPTIGTRTTGTQISRKMRDLTPLLTSIPPNRSFILPPEITSELAFVLGRFSRVMIPTLTPSHPNPDTLISAARNPSSGQIVLLSTPHTGYTIIATTQPPWKQMNEGGSR